MEDIDSLDYHTQVAIKQLEVEKTKYKLKYQHLCNLINMLHDEAFNNDHWRLFILKDCNFVVDEVTSKFKFKVTDVNVIQSAIIKMLTKAETKMLKTLSKHYGYSIGKCEFKIKE